MNATLLNELNRSAADLLDRGCLRSNDLRVERQTIGGAIVIDAGINSIGSLKAGIWLSKLCLADQAIVAIQPYDWTTAVSQWTIAVQTDRPVAACLAAQYAGWPVEHKSYFAMGSGPMRLSRGRETMIQNLFPDRIGGSPDLPIVGILESETLPDAEVIAMIAEQCGTTASNLRLVVAPTYSLAGSIQVVSRCIETAMHKLFELGFDVHRIISAAGTAPLPPVARRGDTVGGIGMTNDAILYGGTATLWSDAEDDQIAAVIEDLPSCSSPDYGQPFATTFKKYDFDFYKVDPMLFSPAKVVIHSLISGKTFSAGKLNHDCLAQSFAQSFA